MILYTKCPQHTYSLNFSERQIISLDQQVPVKDLSVFGVMVKKSFQFSLLQKKSSSAKTMLETKSCEVSQDSEEIKFQTMLPLQAKTTHDGGDLCTGSGITEFCHT